MTNIQFPGNVPPQRDGDANVRDKPTKGPKSSKSFGNVEQQKQPVSEKDAEEKGLINKEEKVEKKKSSLFDLSQSQKKEGTDEGKTTKMPIQKEMAGAKKPEEQVAQQKELISSADSKLKSLLEQKADVETATREAAQQNAAEGKVKAGKMFSAQQEIANKEAAIKGEGKVEGKVEALGEEGFSKKGRVESGSSEGRPELAALEQSKQNPFSESSTQIDTKVGRDEAAKPSETIQQIADKIVEKLQTVRTGDKIETTITLKSPPVLEGASVTVTSSATAKGQIEISFQNLSQDGKLLIDQNSASLKLALEKNGYAVHDIVSVPKEIQAAPMSAETSKEQREGQRDQGRGGEGGGGEGGGRGKGQGQQQQQRNR